MFLRFRFFARIMVSSNILGIARSTVSFCVPAWIVWHWSGFPNPLCPQTLLVPARTAARPLIRVLVWETEGGLSVGSVETCPHV